MEEIDRLIIKEIQGDVVLKENFYRNLAHKIGCSESEVLKRLTNMKNTGILKRVGAVLRHRNIGYKSNGMLVCCISPKEINNAGTFLASLSQVSHCYERKTNTHWPYNLYAMIHGNSDIEVKNIVEEFVELMNIEKYEILFSTEELKKTSMKFF